MKKGGMKKKQNQQKGKKKTTIKQMERSRKGKCKGGKKVQKLEGKAKKYQERAKT